MATHTVSQAEHSLLDAWVKPEDAGESIAVLATTFEFTSELWERQLLPRFLGMETDTTDALLPFLIERDERLRRCYAAVIMDAGALPQQTESLYWDRIPVFVRGGILHSKIVILHWHKCVRLIVGSANLTESGYRYNHEIFFSVDFHDNEHSAPRTLLIAFLEALKNIAHYGLLNHANELGPARQRLLASLDECKAQVRAWQQIPAEYGARATERLLPILIEPGKKHDLFTQLQPVWKQKKADEIWVVSPFWDVSAANTRRVAAALRDVMRPDATAYFACKGEWIKQGTKAQVEIPELLVKGIEPQTKKWSICPVVAASPADKDQSRTLHAKSFFWWNQAANLHVFYAGSSNFTARGLGLISGNFEAGLALVRRQHEGRDLNDRFPGTAAHYELHGRQVVFAPLPTVADDDRLAGFVLPPFQLIAAYEVVAQTLSIEVVAPDSGLIPHRLVAVAGDGSNEPVLIYQRSDPLPYPWRNQLKRQPFILRLEWQARSRPPQHFDIPVDIAERSELPPPDELRDLTLPELMAYFAGYQPAWQFFGQRGQKIGVKLAELDPLKLVDTTGHLTAQVRRFSSAVAGLRQRFEAHPAVSVEALTAHFYAPIGPWALLKALLRDAGVELNEQADQRVSLISDNVIHDQLNPVVFLAAEFALALQWIPFEHIYDGRRRKQARHAWEGMIQRVRRVVAQLARLDGVDSKMRAYVRNLPAAGKSQ